MTNSTQIENRLVRDAWGVLRSQPALMIFPVLCGVAVLAPTALAVLNIEVPLDWKHDRAWTGILMIVGVMWALLFVTVSNFCNVALIVAADQALRQKGPSVTRAVVAALLRLPTIIGWSVLHACIELSRGRGSLFVSIRSRGRQRTFVMSSLGIDWADAIHLTTPVLALERTGPLASAHRSSDLIHRTWGYEATAFHIFQGIGPLTVLASVTLVVVGLRHSYLHAAPSSPLTVWPVALGILLTPAYLIVTTALRGIMRLALYRFAVDGAPPPGFDAATLACAMEGGHKVPQARAPERA